MLRHIFTILIFIHCFFFFGRTRVVWVTYDHIQHDVHNFVNNDQYRIMVETLKGYENKMIVVTNELLSKMDWM